MDKEIKLNKAQENIQLSHDRYGDMPINTLHIVLNFLEEVQVETLCKAVDNIVATVDAFKLFDKRKKCQVVSCQKSDIARILDKRKYEILDLEDGGYDFSIYSSEDAKCTLSIQVHHLLMDGFSVGLLCEEILKAYQMLMQGELYEYTRPDFYGHPEEEIDESGYWKTYFKDMLPYKPAFSYRLECVKANELRRSLTKDESQKIDQYCKEKGVRPYTVFAAALAIYQMYVQDSQESYIILPRLNRDNDRERRTIGCYVLPVPIRIQNTCYFFDLCKQIERKGKEASAHKKCGLSEILDIIHQSGGEESLLPYTLNYQKSTVECQIDTKLEFSDCGAMTNLITMNVSDWNSEGQYDITYEYRSDILDDKYMDFFHESLQLIIQQGISDTNSVGMMDIMSEREKEYIVSKQQGRQISIQPQDTILTLLESVVNRAGTKKAVVASDGTLSFQEVDQLSNRVANCLVHRGIKRGERVAFRLKRTSNLVTVIFGILKAGAVFLPLDTQYPEGRIEYILDNSGAALVIDEDNVEEFLQFDQDTKVNVDILGADLAYCIYTSGTTGRPKGVLLEHRGIVNIVNPENNPFNIQVTQGGTGILAIGSIAFDISLFEIFVMLLNEMFVVIAPEEAMANGGQLAQLIQKNDVNIMHCTPSRLNEYLEDSEFSTALSKIDYILSAGEVLSKSLVDKLTQQYQVAVFNGYGPTECTIGATITEAGDRFTIGRPVGNMRILLLGKNKNILPYGVTGEIGIAGIGVGRQYLNNPELTSEKFVLIEGERVYCTGDFGYFNAEGKLCYLGRNDDQVKLRGLRIELTEIENTLMSLEGVTSAAVLVMGQNESQHLVGFYCGNETHTADSIKAHLREFLTYYMVPDILVKLEKMPLTPHGKVDKVALSNVEIQFQTVYVAPSSAEEKLICKGFEFALDAEKIGMNDNFFELGGTSLLAAKVLVFAKKNDIPIGFSDIFQYPTPALLAQSIFQRKIRDYCQEMNRLDYSKIESVLAKNKVVKTKDRPLGKVLLTGATGYLGYHLLDSLLENDSVERVYCLVRAGKRISAEKRLKGKLFYYFEGKYTDQIGSRIIVVEGDITDEACVAGLEFDIDTVINCAANVSHFVYGDGLHKVNVVGVQHLIDLCFRKKARLIHISTISISGYAQEQEVFTEQSLYQNQSIFNEYIFSKYEAEYMVLSAAAEGLDVKIMRVGNLQGRLSDGEFQMNLKENAFASQLKCYYRLGIAPQVLQESTVSFSPVDETAKAIILLSRTVSDNTVFNVMSQEQVEFHKLFTHMNSVLDKEIIYKADAEFEELIRMYEKDEIKYKEIESILMEKKEIGLKEVLIDPSITVAILESLGFYYAPIQDEYLTKYYMALEGLGFFEPEDEA